MDLFKAIQQLYDEMRRLERVIASLEELQRQGGTLDQLATPKKRGRKRMTTAERTEVSARMKQYWAARRKKHGNAGVAETKA